jgi:single-strand DNA-binding protein
LNKTMHIGRLTRDPEPIGTNGAKFGFACNNRRLNQQTQQWEEVPVFIDMEIWNRGESKQAERFLQTVRKGNLIYIEGHLKLDVWQDKSGGGQRSALRIVVDNFQYLDKREGGQGGGQQQYAQRQPARPQDPRRRPEGQPAANGGGRGGYVVGDDYDEQGGGPFLGDDQGDIPFGFLLPWVAMIGTVASMMA